MGTNGVSTCPGWVTGLRLCPQEKVGHSPSQVPTAQSTPSQTTPHRRDLPCQWALPGASRAFGVGGHGSEVLAVQWTLSCARLRPVQGRAGVGGLHRCPSEPRLRPRVQGAWISPLTHCVQGLGAHILSEGSPDLSAWIRLHLRPQLVPQPPSRPHTGGHTCSHHSSVPPPPLKSPTPGPPPGGLEGS